jgi:hypothetical protein
MSTARVIDPVKQPLVCRFCGEAFGLRTNQADRRAYMHHLLDAHCPPIAAPSAAPAQYAQTDEARLNWLCQRLKRTYSDPDSETIHTIMSPNIDLRVGDSLRTWIDRQILADSTRGGFKEIAR